MSYFIPGLWHLAASMAFGVTFGVLMHGDPTYYLLQVAFCLPLMSVSCACFFVPDRYAKKGPMKFLHYPLPDWDVLFLGPASHRNWLTHSPVLSIALLGALWKWPNLAQIYSFGTIAMGVSVGIGSHLFWDCVGSRNHKIVFVPYWFALREQASRLWLLGGAALSFAVAAALAGAFASP